MPNDICDAIDPIHYKSYPQKSISFIQNLLVFPNTAQFHTEKIIATAIVAYVFFFYHFRLLCFRHSLGNF